MNMTKILCKGGYAIKKHAPTILTVVGIATTTAAVITTAKKAYEASEKKLYADVKERLEKAEEKYDETADYEGSVSLSDEEFRKEVLKNKIEIYKDVTIATAKQFWLPVTLTFTGVTCTLAGFCILKKRTAALAATLNIVSAAFTKYRTNVIADAGSEKDQLYLNYDLTKTEKNIDVATGEVKETHPKLNITGFDVLFDKFHPYFKENEFGRQDNDMNIMTLKTWVQTLDNKWSAQGYLTVNDIYKIIGYKANVAGAIACYGPKKDARQHFSFGINFDQIDHNTDEVVSFLLGQNDAVWLKICPDTTIDNVMSAQDKQYIY